MGIVVDLHSRNPMGIVQARIALCGVLPCRGPGCTCCVPNLTAVVDVAVCGHVDGMACCCVRYLHQWLIVVSLHSTLYVGADHAGPPHMQALGEWPCGITKPLFHSRWKPIIGPLLGISEIL